MSPITGQFGVILLNDGVFLPFDDANLPLRGVSLLHVDVFFSRIHLAPILSGTHLHPMNDRLDSHNVCRYHKCATYRAQI